MKMMMHLPIIIAIQGRRKSIKCVEEWDNAKKSLLLLLRYLVVKMDVLVLRMSLNRRNKRKLKHRMLRQLKLKTLNISASNVRRTEQISLINKTKSASHAS
jgi:hypothetical protein